MGRRRMSARLLAAAATVVMLVVATGAWTNHTASQASRPLVINVAHGASLSEGVTTTKSLEAFWWNDGSCHGYPDVMQLYEVFRDETGTLVEYRDAGITDGSDSCQVHHSATFASDPDYLDCGGCFIEPDGLTQGSPTGSTTGHPE